MKLKGQLYGLHSSPAKDSILVTALYAEGITRLFMGDFFSVSGIYVHSQQPERISACL